MPLVGGFCALAVLAFAVPVVECENLLRLLYAAQLVETE
jgi:hypothetical protein